MGLPGVSRSNPAAVAGGASRAPGGPPAHLETVIRCRPASFVVQDGDGRTAVVISNAVIRIEGDPDTEPGR